MWKCKILKNKFNNKAKDWYTENNKTLPKLNPKSIQKSCARGLKANIVKMTILPKAMRTFSAIPTKIPTSLLEETEKSIRKFIWNLKGAWILKKKKKSWKSRTKLENFHFYIVTLQSYRNQNRVLPASGHVDGPDGLGRPQINAHAGDRWPYWGITDIVTRSWTRTVIPTNGAGKTGHEHGSSNSKCLKKTRT